MNFAQVPVGFSMALAQNEEALAAYAAMTQQQKQALLDRARKARSHDEMYRIVSSIASGAENAAM